MGGSHEERTCCDIDNDKARGGGGNSDGERY